MSSKSAYTQKPLANFKINKVFGQKPIMVTVSEKQLRIILPYLGNMSYLTRTKLAKAIIKNLKLCNL